MDNQVLASYQYKPMIMTLGHRMNKALTYEVDIVTVSTTESTRGAKRQIDRKRSIQSKKPLDHQPQSASPANK